MSAATLEKPTSAPTINITDVTGTECRLLFIDGQSIEEYFAKSEILTAPVDGQVAIVDGLPAQLNKPVEPYASVAIGLFADLG